MRVAQLLAVFVPHLAFASHLRRSLQPPGGGGGGITCSANQPRFGTPSAGDCIDSFRGGQTYSYPEDFPITNEVSIYTCPTSEKRIIVSNGIPDHDITQRNPNQPCVLHWMVTMPLSPSFGDAVVEPAPLGMIAMSLNGVPVFGAQEGGGTNAAETLPDAEFTAVPYYGHAARVGNWHYHSGEFGRVEDLSDLSSDTLIGYAADGFPIYGPLEDDSDLDECNGVGATAEEYKYHVRSFDQVDEFHEYCDGTSPAIKWNYVLGCYKGDLSSSRVDDSTTTSLPADCVLEGDPGEEPVDAPSIVERLMGFLRRIFGFLGS